MTWKAVETLPICIGDPVPRARAEAVSAALLTRVLPLARLVHGRVEPLATASLIADGDSLALLTAAHVFEHATVGDLAIPLPRDGGWACLYSMQTRVIVHPTRDIALVILNDRSQVRRLWSNWVPVPASHLEYGTQGKGARTYVVAGYPLAQARRIDGAVCMKPVVVFTRALDDGCYGYTRTAERIDGLDIHTPALDGVSGGLVWAVYEDDSSDFGCQLRATSMQVAFVHGRHLRTEPLIAAHLLVSRLR